ncbi:putative transcriptional regulator [Caulobacter ginsengisoli]|uniref:Transcriptional regulator n=1 Tax=Caulobacter ginsengisoli TaxID=400775 RepID=A0ABU0J116_9CAUL|nr:cupin domain-containing protein [Caulobacter ginsengisoli]MDQ0466994.1 putative transcriptional regulator [Caulobacter ginsengisoli]
MTPLGPHLAELRDPESDPGLRLMAAAAAAIREEPPRPGDDLAAAFLETEATAPLAPDAADQVLARIDQLEAIDERAHKAGAAKAAGRYLGELTTLPDPIREVVYAAMQAGGRWLFTGPGLRRLEIPTGGEGKTILFRIEPGAGVGSHDHLGDEYTLVLTGSFQDGHRRYGPGDVNIGRPGFVHQPVADPGPVCYALGVEFGGAKFDGFLGLVQKLTQ